MRRGQAGCSNNADVSVALQFFDTRANPLCWQFVIGINKCQDFTLRLLDTPISQRAYAQIRIAEHRCPLLGSNCGRRVAGTVVNDDDLIALRGIVLVAKRTQAHFQSLRIVPHRYDDRHQRPLRASRGLAKVLFSGSKQVIQSQHEPKATWRLRRPPSPKHLAVEFEVGVYHDSQIVVAQALFAVGLSEPGALAGALGEFH